MDIILSSYEYPPTIGGEGKYTQGLARALYDLGHIVHIVTTDIEVYDNFDSGNIDIIRIPIIKKLPGLKTFSFGVSLKKKCKEIWNTQDIDIIHQTYDYYKIPFSKKDIDAQVVATIHHPFLEERRAIRDSSNNLLFFQYFIHQRSEFLAFMQRKVCERADKIIAVSNFTKRSIINDYSIPPHNIEVIPNGIDILKFNPNINGYGMRKKLGFECEPIILYVGKLEWNKGVDNLLIVFSKVVKEFPDAKLIIVGRGSQEKRLKKLADRINLTKSAIFMGKVQSEELPLLFAASDVFVLPSLMEGFGIVLLEAMACGKPCITTKAGGSDDVVLNGETGLIVPPINQHSLYQAILTLLNDDDLAQKFGDAGRKRVEEKFSWDVVARQTIKVYKA